MSTPRALFPSAVLASAALAALMTGCGPASRSAALRPSDAAAPPSAQHDTGAALVRAPTPPAAPTGRHADFRRLRLSKDARDVAEWVVSSADHRDLPFIIVDKVNATVIAFDAAGRLQRTSPALLGLARGDDSVPGIGERPIAQIRPEERTTPAGRFEAEMGTNANGEDILWVDYDAAISMHRVRTSNRAERRLQRLASPSIADNRISYGCINLPAAFYDEVVKPLFAARNGIVYVLPETRPARAVFGAVNVARSTTSGHLR